MIIYRRASLYFQIVCFHNKIAAKIIYCPNSTNCIILESANCNMSNQSINVIICYMFLCKYV